MERLYQPSNVAGPPFWEYSTYALHTYTSDSDHPAFNAYARTDYMGIGGKGMAARDVNKNLLFLYVQRTLTISPHKNGTDAEPNDSALAKKYDAAAQSATLLGLRNACTKLHGSMSGELCIPK